MGIPKVRPRLTDEQRDLAAEHVAMMIGLVRTWRFIIPHLEDVLYDAAVDALFETARHYDPAKGDFGPLLKTKLRGFVSNALRRAKPKGYRINSAPRTADRAEGADEL